MHKLTCKVLAVIIVHKYPGLAKQGVRCLENSVRCSTFCRTIASFVISSGVFSSMLHVSLYVSFYAFFDVLFSRPPGVGLLFAVAFGKQVLRLLLCRIWRVARCFVRKFQTLPNLH